MNSALMVKKKGFMFHDLKHFNLVSKRFTAGSNFSLKPVVHLTKAMAINILGEIKISESKCICRLMSLVLL